MEIENENATPAGVDEGANAPMTLDAAVSLMSQWPDDEAEPQTETVEQPVTGEVQQEEQTAEVETAQATEETEGEPEGGQETQPEENVFDWEKVPGTAKFRLRDGSEVTAADLKRDWDALRTARQANEQINARVAEIQQVQARVAQEAQMFAQVAPRAIAALKASLPEVPPYPDEKLLREDPFAHQEAVDAHFRGVAARNAKIAEIQQIEHAAAVHQQQAKKAEEAQFQQRLKGELDELHRKVPDLRDRTKMEALATDIQKYGKEVYGFKDGEMDIFDHRVILMARDAIEYRKLKANPPKPVQQQPGKVAAPAVAAPGPRPSGDATKVQQYEQLKQKARQSGGDIRSVASLIAQLD